MGRLTAILVAACSAVLAGQQPTFRAGTDLVTLGATITDRRGNFLADLNIEDFEVFEDGERQTVTYFARGGESSSSPQLHVGLLFDTSGSMGQEIALARSAAVRFLNTLREAVDITLVDFDTEVRLARYGQDDFPRIVERIRSRQPDGFTALYDALGLQRARLRLVGVRVEGLVPRDTVHRQLVLGERERGWSDADRAVDRASRRFGSDVVRPASLVGTRR